MSQSPAENLSLTRALTLLAATLAILLGTLVPFAAMASARPGQPIVLCSSRGLQTIHVGGIDGPMKQDIGAECAACVLPLQTALLPSHDDLQPPVRVYGRADFPAFDFDRPAPARQPPRPPSTAPPCT